MHDNMSSTQVITWGCHRLARHNVVAAPWCRAAREQAPATTWVLISGALTLVVAPNARAVAAALGRAELAAVVLGRIHYQPRARLSTAFYDPRRLLRRQEIGRA